MFSANADYINLEGGDVVRASKCTFGKKIVECVWVKQDDKLYMVVIDHKGERDIYWISPKGDVLIWAREAI